jgi:glycosyltransferase involved in cell wall biosynthesis
MTTVKHFEYAVPFLLRIKDKYGDKVSIKMIGDRRYRHERLGIQGVSWIKEDELKELSGIDIGIMPLPDDEWSRGKCGLKGLQYMALEIPAVMSPVGVNTEIISDGTNGFLARTEDEWVNKISALVESATLRSKIGKAGRATVEERYSVKSQAQNYLRYFDEVLGL